MEQNLFKILERMWLAGAVIGIVGCIYCLTVKDNDSALFFMGFFILSSVIYYARRKQSKKHQAYLDENKKAGK